MSHKSRLGIVIIDCKTEDLAEATEFWSAALGCKPIHNPEHPEYVMMETPEGHIRVALQAVSHDSRVHLDIATDDRLAERSRLEKLGAQTVRHFDQYGRHWTVMEAPTGHRFCLVKPQRPDFDREANRWDGV